MPVSRISATMLPANSTSKRDTEMFDIILQETRKLGVGKTKRLMELLCAQALAKLDIKGATHARLEELPNVINP